MPERVYLLLIKRMKSSCDWRYRDSSRGYRQNSIELLKFNQVVATGHMLDNIQWISVGIR